MHQRFVPLFLGRAAYILLLGRDADDLLLGRDADDLLFGRVSDDLRAGLATGFFFLETAFFSLGRAEGLFFLGAVDMDFSWPGVRPVDDLRRATSLSVRVRMLAREMPRVGMPP